MNPEFGVGETAGVSCLFYGSDPTTAVRRLAYVGQRKDSDRCSIIVTYTNMDWAPVGVDVQRVDLSIYQAKCMIAELQRFANTGSIHETAVPKDDEVENEDVNAEMEEEEEEDERSSEATAQTEIVHDAEWDVL